MSRFIQLVLLTIYLLVVGCQAVKSKSFSVNEQKEIMVEIAKLIELRYVDADKARQIASSIREASGVWKSHLDGDVFASKVTELLRKVSEDGHLGLSFSPEPIPENLGDRKFTEQEMEKWYGAHRNYGLEKVERLENNVMLLDLRVFPPSGMAGDIFASAMTLVAQGEALIIDLRKNGGGSDTMNLLTGYVLDGGSQLSGVYNRPKDEIRYVTSPTWVPGRRFGSKKPLYILTSKRTFSAAEAFTYDLQVLGRAVVVGETTGGGAHPFEYRRVHKHFAVNLPESRSVNPITDSNWQGVGVKPDVEIAADKALNKALELIEGKVEKENIEN